MEFCTGEQHKKNPSQACASSPEAKCAALLLCLLCRWSAFDCWLLLIDFPDPVEVAMITALELEGTSAEA